ncbi:hypothetical protein DMB92_01635 [Campylobacter sp. MIT 99-7217]|uniref:hypothetical protein n=1 Tax=Campylobacter sp. MIT 99-7217 TaxID=535091 RepID=UPI00115965DF|nr:hypothetical protein [Campylobacter sp. MIT 99-7217]TQR34687.1 hypothetical protein DMB92_01635 [Campylobacter sp. MIT 99-7217]
MKKVQKVFMALVLSLLCLSFAKADKLDIKRMIEDCKSGKIINLYACQADDLFNKNVGDRSKYNQEKLTNSYVGFMSSFLAVDLLHNKKVLSAYADDEYMKNLQRDFLEGFLYADFKKNDKYKLKLLKQKPDEFFKIQAPIWLSNGLSNAQATQTTKALSAEQEFFEKTIKSPT